MHMTKHCYGVYSTEPGTITLPTAPAAADTVAITDVHDGPVTVASYTVAHGRDGAPDWGLVIGDIGDGSRAYGKVEDAALLAEMEANEFVGATVQLVPADGGVNLVKA
jgi:acetyl-CoA C-acetyltransferase